MKHLRNLALLILAVVLSLPAWSYAATISNGGSVRGKLSYPGQLATYTFRANAGDIVNLSLADTGSTPFRPSLTLYAPDGKKVASDWSRDVAGISHRKLQQTGVFRAQVGDRRGNRTGDYELHLARVPGANEAGRLRSQTLRSEALSIGDIDTFTFLARAGDVLFISMTDTSADGVLTPFISVYAPDGSRIARDRGRNEAEKSNVTLPLTGIYTVVAKEFSDKAVAGEYTLGIQLVRDGSIADCLVDDARNQYTLADNEYALLALPCQPPSDATIADLFGDDIPGSYGVDWAVFTYDVGRRPTPGYVLEKASGKLRSGQGFWIVQTTGPDVVLDLPQGSRRAGSTSATNPACTGVAGCRSVRLSGAVPPTDPDSGNAVSEQWNLIGNPASGTEFSATPAAIRITAPAGPCMAATGGCDPLQASAADLTSDVAFIYTGRPQYTQLTANDRLKAWQGYWVAERPGATGNRPIVLFPVN